MSLRQVLFVLLNADVDVTMMMTEGLTQGLYLAESITTPAHALMLDMNRAGVWHRGRTTGQSMDMHGISGHAWHQWTCIFLLAKQV